VLKLAAILQIADGLDRSHQQLVRDVRCEITGATATLRLECETESELELWSADRKARWFREIFRVAVKFESILPSHVRQESSAASGV
jgi:exopolyphosphatase/guanosine-5'-triphosphate,3'-diphosphate pyrophosphatase